MTVGVGSTDVDPVAGVEGNDVALTRSRDPPMIELVALNWISIPGPTFGRAATPVESQPM